VRDIEALREHLGVGRWTLLGGSWGVALSLAYACAHPARVRALLLRGVCLMRRAEIDWAFRCGGGADGLAGAAALYPGSWAAFTRALGVPMAPTAGGADPVQVAFDALSGTDAARRAAVASAWMRWGGVIGSPPPAKGVQVWDGRAWATRDGGDESAGADAMRLAAAAPKKARKKASDDSTSDADASAASSPAAASAQCPPMSRGEAQALLEARYCLAEGFFSEADAGGPLLSRLQPLLAARVPALAVHGRADALCPVASAWALHAAWPQLELRVVAAEGHSMYQRGVTHALICASDAFRDLPL
jgi:proline iminopeptidase